MSGEHHFRRQGPLLELLPAVWVRLDSITSVVPTEDAGGYTVVTAAERTYCINPEVAVIVSAIADACLDWRREQAQAEEEGRLMALDAQRMPPGEEEAQGPPGGLITGLGYEEWDNPFS